MDFLLISTVSPVNVFSVPDVCLITFPLAYYVVRIQYLIHIACKICINRLFMLWIRILVSSRLWAVKFLGYQKLHMDFSTVCGVGTPNPHIVQEYTVLDHCWAEKWKRSRNEEVWDKDLGTWARWGPGSSAIEPHLSFPPTQGACPSLSLRLAKGDWPAFTLFPASDSGLPSGEGRLTHLFFVVSEQAHASFHFLRASSVREEGGFREVCSREDRMVLGNSK